MSLTAAQKRDLQLSIEQHLVKIERLFKQPKITLVVRAPQLDDGDVVLTNDSLGDAIAAIQRLKDREPTHRPEVGQEGSQC